MGLTYQLSTSACCKGDINTAGFNFGTGAYNTLLGFNVIGAAIAWALCGLTLLENSEGSNLLLSAAAGNNIVKLVRRALAPVGRVLGGRQEAEETRPVGTPVSSDVVNKGSLDTEMGLAKPGDLDRVNSSMPLTGE